MTQQESREATAAFSERLRVELRRIADDRRAKAVTGWISDRKRVLLAAIVLVLAAICYGRVELSGGVRAKSLVEQVYFAARLFTLDHEGLPEVGRAPWLALLWGCYFAAPIITGSLVVSFAQTIGSIIWTPTRAAAKVGDHYVVAGLGKHASLLLEWLDKNASGIPMVAIELDPSTPNRFELESGRTIPVVKGNMTDLKVLQAAGVKRASRFYAMTGDDAVNLSACLAAKTENPKIIPVAVLADVGTEAALGDLCSRKGVTMFNPYEIAATEMVDDLLENTKFGETLEAGVVIAGFGRFGKMLAKSLLDRRNECSVGKIVVIDRDATRIRGRFLRTYKYPDAQVDAVDGDFEDPDVITRALDGVDGATLASPPAIFLCADSDATNFRTALLLRERWQVSATIVSRMARMSGELSDEFKQDGLRGYDLSELIRKGITKKERREAVEHSGGLVRVA